MHAEAPDLAVGRSAAPMVGRIVAKDEQWIVRSVETNDRPDARLRVAFKQRWMSDYDAPPPQAAGPESPP